MAGFTMGGTFLIISPDERESKSASDAASTLSDTEIGTFNAFTGKRNLSFPAVWGASGAK